MPAQSSDAWPTAPSLGVRPQRGSKAESASRWPWTHSFPTCNGTLESAACGVNWLTGHGSRSPSSTASHAPGCLYSPSLVCWYSLSHQLREAHPPLHTYPLSEPTPGAAPPVQQPAPRRHLRQVERLGVPGDAPKVPKQVIGCSRNAFRHLSSHDAIISWIRFAQEFVWSVLRPGGEIMVGAAVAATRSRTDGGGVGR